jgi:hypothetical protein
VIVWVVVRRVNAIEGNPLPVAAMSQASFAASILDQDTPHRLGRGSKKVGSTVPADFLFCLLRRIADEAEVCLMHQGSWVEGLSWAFLRKLGRSQASEFVVDEGGEIGWSTSCSLRQTV